MTVKIIIIKRQSLVTKESLHLEQHIRIAPEVSPLQVCGLPPALEDATPSSAS